jgi:hypothetical protein
MVDPMDVVSTVGPRAGRVWNRLGDGASVVRDAYGRLRPIARDVYNDLSY